MIDTQDEKMANPKEPGSYSKTLGDLLGIIG